MPVKFIDNKNRRLYIFWFFIIILTLFRIFLFLSIPLDAMGNTPHDDYLLLSHANSISQGNWLGEYNNRTLVKGISFPLFVAVCKWICIPYELGLAFFYIFSVLIFIRGIKNLISNLYQQGILYLFLLYSPAMLSKVTQQRPYNLALIPPTVLLITGCFIGLFLRCKDQPRKLIPWAILSGLSLAFFWFVREDSIWLLPFVLGALLISYICIVKQNVLLKKKLISLGILILPLCLLWITSLGISAINQIHYHTFTTNERTKSSFSDVMSDLVRMDAPEVRADVWVSHDTINRAMEFSPTLASIQESIDLIYESGWSSGGEIPGDIIAWAIRDAAADAGYFTDGAASEEFFRKVHFELQEAYVSGACEQKPGIFLSSLSDGFVFSEDFSPLIDSSLKAWKRLLLIEGTEVEIFAGTGSIENLRFFEAMTLSPVVYPDNEAFTSDPVGSAVQRPVVYAQRFLKLYHLAVYLLLFLSVLCYIWMIWDMICRMRRKKYDTWYLWLIITGLIGCAAIQIVEVSWFTAYLGDAENIVYSYCTGALTLIQIIQFLTIWWGFRKITLLYKKRRNVNT